MYEVVATVCVNENSLARKTIAMSCEKNKWEEVIGILTGWSLEQAELYRYNVEWSDQGCCTTNKVMSH